MILNFAACTRLRMSAVNPRPTASGLTIASVLSTAIRFISQVQNSAQAGRPRAANYFFFFADFFDFAAPAFFFAAGFALDFDLPRTAAIVWPISAGLCTVRIPAARFGLYFSAAVPPPPLVMAPALPPR